MLKIGTTVLFNSVPTLILSLINIPQHQPKLYQLVRGDMHVCRWRARRPFRP
jgi:hypothetical protein